MTSRKHPFAMCLTMCLTMCLIGVATSAEPHFAPWRIVSAADWHSAEGGVTSKDPAAFEANQAKERNLIRGTVFCRPDVVLIAGDVGSGHWTAAALKRAGAMSAAESSEQAIHRLGEKTYRSMKDNFAAAGIDRLLVCVGDHGLGDNDWPPGSERAQCVPYHRAIFGASFNTDRQGKWLWPAEVCAVPARPLGTKYENTSFAMQHKNVLFVMVDVFHQEGPNDTLHPRHGSVQPDLAGEHLAWFERVLTAAESDPSVRYVFVQGHTPVAPPVRAQSSSMMMADGFEQSNMWRMMRRHNVDLYFAGEVHATTVSKDTESDIVQLVTDRNLPTMITVFDDKIQLQCFERSLNPDGTIQENPLRGDHRLTIDKSDGKTSFTDGHGVLRPLDTREVFIHYSFDESIAAPSRESKKKEPSINTNTGRLDFPYDAKMRNCKQVDGLLGDGLQLNEGGFCEVNGTGPFGLFYRTERTMTIWFKTKSDGQFNLICAGSGFKSNKNSSAGFMDLGIKKGNILVRTDAGEQPIEGARVDDGHWHHAAMVVMPDAKVLDDIQVYIDGKPQAWPQNVDTSQPVGFAMGIYGISLGGAHRPVWRNSKRNAGVAVFDGEIDDFAAWYRALSDEEIDRIYQSAIEENRNAVQVDLWPRR